MQPEVLAALLNITFVATWIVIGGVLIRRPAQRQ